MAFLSMFPLAPPATAQPKRRRNQPGTPNCVFAGPNVEIVALSPRTLMATNRFFCEVCGEGFKREQNLQLHRRCHKLPGTLKRKSTVAAEHKVYLCPEPSCIHHDPSRALRDLTGIKKHFLRKHGEKKYSCEKCFKKYAVQSDLKTHYKKCQMRQYHCDCGALFSRHDIFMVHRSFCNALAQEVGGTNTIIDGDGAAPSAFSLVHHNLAPSSASFRPPLVATPPLSFTFQPPPPTVASSSFFMHAVDNLHDYRLKLVAVSPMHGHSDDSSSSAPPSTFNLSHTFTNLSSIGGTGSFNLFKFNSSNEFTDDGAIVPSLPTIVAPPLQPVGPPHMLAMSSLHKGSQLGSSSSSTNASIPKFIPDNATPKLEHQPLFGMTGMHSHRQQVASIQDLFTSIQGPPLNYSSYPNVGPPPGFGSSSSDYGLTQNFLGMHATTTERSSGGGENSVNRKGAVPSTNFNGVGGIWFK